MTTTTEELTDRGYEIADRLEDVLRSDTTGAGFTPSAAARKAKIQSGEVYSVLSWMVQNQYAHTSGNGAWTHYHAGRSW